MELDKKLSEELDDMLVSDEILPKRTTKLIAPPRGMMGMLMSVKQPPRVDFRLEIYPNETEEPHFKITYQNVTCRFKIMDCEPMKAEAENGIPPQIKKIMKHIKKTWQDNKDEIIKTWQATRPTSQNHGHQNIR